MSNGAGPSQVLIIRHGEKLGDLSSEGSGGPDLSIRGSARAAALPSLFVPATPELTCALAAGGGTTFEGAYRQVSAQGGPPRFRAPDFLFAAKASANSNRPVETITPLAVALQLEMNAKHSDDDYPKVASDILTNAKYARKVVLVCWHHGNIPRLAEALGAQGPLLWPGGVFDRVWQITYADGSASFQNLPQMLLFNDSGS
ncbi:MAG TPA: hypothetical protein VFE78_18805 [Gemmataceae bacterium]|jgi:hypothetical protein|nr:hypothetical protein [Gemmataceae bacterium]